MDKTINSYINQLHLDPKKEKAVRQIVELAGGSGGGMTEVTYAELRELRDNGKLIPGAKYRMIDYETVVVDDAYEYNRDEQDIESFKIASENFPFDLILTAIDENNLDERCNAVWSERDVDGYFANSDLLAWDVRYSMDSHKYIWSAEHNKTIILFDYYFGDFVKGYLDISMSEKYHIYAWKIPALSTKEYTAYAATMADNMENLPSDNLHSSIIAIYEDGHEESIGGMSIINIYNKQGKGTIYRLIDEHNNSCPYDFKNFKAYFGNNFEFTFAINEPVDASTIYNTGFVNNNYIGERTFLGYRTKINVVTFNSFRASYANSPITNNHIGNNALFNWILGNNNIIGDNSYNNGINGDNNVIAGNASSNNIDGTNIILKKYCSTNNIIGENITFEEKCHNNELKHTSTDYSNKCYNITFGSNCYFNVLDDSKNITFGSQCNYNNIKGRNINFDSACSSNEIKTTDVTFSSNCTYNTITGGQYITFDKDCTRNTIESGITITIGSSCSNNVFSGNNLEKCRNIKLGDECRNNELMCLMHVTFGNYCTGNKFSCDNTTQPGCIFKTKFEDNCSNLIYVQHLTNSYTSPYNIKLHDCTLPYLSNQGDTSRLKKYITYLRQRNDGTIITYTDEEVYDAIQATKVEPESTES